MEALSGAASVIGVASLAIQVCGELKKVHDFWQSVREAPDDVAHISTEIELFMTWLAVIANNYQRQGFDHKNPNHVAATDTLKLCLATVRDMNGGVKDLQSRFAAGPMSRRWASVNFVFRKERWEKVMQQNERMKSLLIIVQTCYIGDLQELGFRSLSMSLRPRHSPLQTTSNGNTLDIPDADSATQELIVGTQELQLIPTLPVEIVSFDPGEPPSIHKPRRSTTRQQNERAYNVGLAMLRLVTSVQESVLLDELGNERRIPTRRTRYDLRIAQWLLSRGFSWQSIDVYGGWQHVFRTFRYIPEDSLIVDFCVEGDLANVQRMFDKGLASPFDRVAWEDQDFSLLHYSSAYCHAQLSRFLIECGLGHGSASGMSRYSILEIPKLYDVDETTYNPAAHLDTVRVMVNEGQYDPMEDSNGYSVMHDFRGSSTIYQWLLDQDEFLIDFEQKAHGWRTVVNTLIMSTNRNSSSCLKAVLAHRRDTKDLSGVQQKDLNDSLAYAAIVCMPFRADDIDFPKRIRVLWDAGADLHTPKSDNNFGTSLDHVFLGFSVKHKEGRFKTRRCGAERDNVPPPPLMSTEDIQEYDQLDDTPDLKYRPRLSRSQWHTWFSRDDLREDPREELLVLEVLQRHLDAWMEILLEAELDLVEYGRREEELHPEGVVSCSHGEARLCFEYGDHVDGCRIHVTEIWMYADEESVTSVETSTMPGTWDFDDE